jgi:hypothetical protein
MPQPSTLRLILNAAARPPRGQLCSSATCHAAAPVCVCVCVFITAGPSTKPFAGVWGGGYGRTCATRDNEPRPVWTKLPITHVLCVCVFITAGHTTKLFAWGGGGGCGRTCVTRDDEPRPVWTRLPITHVCVCLLLQDLLQSCLRGGGCVFITAGPSTKLFTWGGGVGGYGRTCVFMCVCLLLQDHTLFYSMKRVYLTVN